MHTCARFWWRKYCANFCVVSHSDAEPARHSRSAGGCKDRAITQVLGGITQTVGAALCRCTLCAPRPGRVLMQLTYVALLPLRGVPAW